MSIAFLIFLASCGGDHDGFPMTAAQEATQPSIEIAPKGAPLGIGESLRFTATVRGAVENSLSSITWFAFGGTIDQTGLFVAGDQPGTYRVRAEVETDLQILSDTTAGFVTPTEIDETGNQALATVLLEEDFESNNFRQWSGLAPSSDPRWNGTGDGGAHIGDGYITTERVRSGNLAWKAMIDPTRASFGLRQKSSLENWRATRGVSEFSISAWYFIPGDYPAVSSLIMQIKSVGSASSYKPVAFRITRDRELIVYSGILGKTLFKTGVKAPVERWFNLTGRFVIADSGLVEMWLDGNKIASIQTDTKDNDYAYPGVGNYVNSSDYPVTCHIFIDDIRVTTEPPF